MASPEAALHRAAFLMRVIGEEAVESEAGGALMEAAEAFISSVRLIPRPAPAGAHALQSPYADYRDIVVLPRHDHVPMTAYGIVSVLAQQEVEGSHDGARTYVLAARPLTADGAALPHSPEQVAVKVTTLPVVQKLSGSYVDALRDVATEWKNAAKITKKHGISNRFVNAHDAAFPAHCLLSGRLHAAFAWTMDFCQGGTLNEFLEWLTAQPWLGEPARLNCLLPVIFDLLTALKQLHSLHLGHRDLHEGNILFDREGTLNIGDFGRAKKKVHDVLRAQGDALNLTVYGEKHTAPPDSTHPHPATLSIFTDEAYYDPLGVDLWSLGTLISDMLCPPHAQLKWPSEEQVAQAKRARLIQLCVEHRRQQVRKHWSPQLKAALDGRLFDWTLRAFRVDTKGVTITDADLRFLFPKQRPPDAVFRAVWQYYHVTQRREKDPFLDPDEREEAAAERAAIRPPYLNGGGGGGGREKKEAREEKEAKTEEKEKERERKEVPLKKRREPPPRSTKPEPPRTRARF